MSKQRFLKRNYLIINFLRSKPNSFKKIQEYLEQQSFLEEENYEVTLRTFQRDVKEIESTFGIEIRYNRSQGVYEIIENEDENEDKYDRLIESFEVFNALNLSNNFEKHIITEKRKPLGLENMNGLLHAIKNKLEIQFLHEKYWTKEEEEKQLKIICPLAVKEARFRWYLIGIDTKDNIIKTFGLDRLTKLEILQTTFTDSTNFDVEKKFRHSFGIVTNENEIPKKIVLSFTYNQGKYIKSFPLHHSQKEIINTKQEYRIELLLHPTYDFVMELMSIGVHVKVIEPISLQEEIKRKLKDALDLYN
jgi:predicted DNA-binding transcriptional regulator YafY